jgi:hypothetical protein
LPRPTGTNVRGPLICSSGLAVRLPHPARRLLPPRRHP